MPIRAAIHESRPDIADRAGIYCRKSIPPAGGIKKSTIFNINLKIMRLKLFLLLLLSAALPVLAQTASVAGVVVDANTGTPVSGATVMLRDQGLASTTGPAGDFRISNAAPGQDYVMVVAYGYADAEKAVELFNKQTVDAGLIRLADNEQHTDYYEDQNDLIFDESALEDEEGAGQSIGALTGASDNIFYNAANYDFSQMYFRQRGYDRWYQQTYINGVNFNDLARGYFNYSSIGGMNRAFRNKTTAIGLDAADFGFGDLGGQTNISTRATDYAPGFNGSVMYTNSNYMFRAMALYSTGLNKHGWALTAGAIGRYAKEGIVPGSFYNSGGYFLAVEKVFNRQHSLSLTAFGAPTQRAGSSPTTDEAANSPAPISTTPTGAGTTARNAPPASWSRSIPHSSSTGCSNLRPAHRSTPVWQHAGATTARRHWPTTTPPTRRPTTTATCRAGTRISLPCLTCTPTCGSTTKA